MNTVRICDPTKNMPRAYIEGIEAETNWTPEEVAVLAGLDLDEIGVGYAIHLSVHKRDKTLGKVKTLTEFIRLHIQAEIKRQEASK